jgi:glycosyltransferase involved in cell wall biosynthesis
MKILHAMSGNPVGGTELAFERTVAALTREGIAQRVIIRANGERKTRLNAVGVEPIELPFRTRFDFTSKRRLNNEIASFGADLVISWTPDVSVLVDPQSSKHMGYIGKEFPVTKIQGCDHLFVASQQRVDRVTATGWPKERISLLPFILPSDATPPIARKTFFIPDTARLVVVVGGLKPENGIDVLLEAIARISGLYLWVVGEGPLRRQLENRALEIGIKPRTRFVGWRYDAASLLGAADLVICPARQDDIGSQVLEAWACKKPVIAADSLGPSLLIRHRENGVLVPIDDPLSLAEAIKWVIQDSDFSERIAFAGFEAFRESHTTSETVPQYVSVFRRVVDNTVDAALSSYMESI